MSKKSKADKELEKKLNKAMRDFPKHMNEHLREKEAEKTEKEKQERRDILDSLNKELETGSECRACNGAIVEYRTEKIRQRTGMEVYGGHGSAMGKLPPIYYKSKYYCKDCRTKYEPPLLKSNRT
ncbi:MAG: hypothetical protein Q8L47_05270 [bacterium]|nr:hypothetical protein [bacterium]